MALVGHESAAMGARYTHVGKDALAKAAKTLPVTHTIELGGQVEI